MTPFVKLSQAHRRGLAASGGKALQLSRLAGQLKNATVLDGSVVTASALQSLHRTDKLPQWVRRLSAQFSQSPLVIVRSSATAEDGAKVSLAGHFESQVCPSGAAALGQTLRAVWAQGVSVYEKVLKRRTETATQARARGQRSLALLVQPAVAGERSGVCFAQSPLHAGRAMIVAGLGTCHGVVDGTLATDTFLIDANGFIEQRISHKFEMTWLNHLPSTFPGQPLRTPLGKTALHLPHGPRVWTAKVPPRHAEAAALSEAQVRRVVALAREVEHRLGFQPDIEFSFVGSTLYLLQARPITTQVTSTSAPLESDCVIASPGTASGPIRIVRGLDDLANVQRGDVVAVGATDPEYLPLFRKAAAVLSEEGSPLSHTAIVARELGLPCLVNVSQATSGRFQEGEFVTVDATHGRIEQRASESMHAVARDEAPRPTRPGKATEALSISTLVAEVAHRLGSGEPTAAAQRLAKQLAGRHLLRWDSAPPHSSAERTWYRALLARRP